eukprot:TRINITY_DN3793_c1_g1_i2.p1 TRINITY_DN3793_c1_g1~~TRINITY_DN3793_c1_g1_i2.p1  ORF type:complete len:623 (+),score=126.09 TRINITY_DN3793_c1_g1_i2:2241-4109(+)
MHRLNANVDLYYALKLTSVADGGRFFRDHLNEEQRTTSRSLLLEYENGGIGLPDFKRQQLIQYNEHASILSAKFTQVINAVSVEAEPDASGVVKPRVEVVEVPRDTLHNYPRNFFEDRTFMQGKDGRAFVSATKANAIIRYTKDPKIRKMLFVAANRICPENLVVLEELLQTRYAAAHILGHDSFAHQSMQSKMAKHPDTAQAFLHNLTGVVSAKASEEIALLKAMKAKEQPGDDEIHAWDRAYYTGKSLANAGVGEVGNFLSLGHCLQGITDLVSDLFSVDLNLVPMSPGEDWTEDVRGLGLGSNDVQPVYKLEVNHKTDGDLGVIYLDLFARPGKYSNCANFVTKFVRKKSPSGQIQPGKLAIVCAFDPPSSSSSSATTTTTTASDDSSLSSLNSVRLRHHQLETLFHEFGHAIATVLSRTEFQHTSGTRAQLDFIETPSTLMEHFAWDHRILSRFAKHHTTGQEIPKSLISTLRQSKNMFAGIDTQQQIMYSLFDLQIHSAAPDRDGEEVFAPSSLIARFASLQNEHSAIKYAPDTWWFSQFGHLSHYASGYYAYLYSQMFSSNLWHTNFSADPLNRDVGTQFHQSILRHGGGRDPNDTIRDMLGGEPNPELFARSLVS